MKGRNTKHLLFIRSLPCLICGNDVSTEAAHIRYGQPPIKPYTGKGQKPHDKWTVPLCSYCHRAQHRVNEAYWWRSHGIDPIKVALELYSVTGDYQCGHMVCEQVWNRQLTG